VELLLRGFVKVTTRLASDQEALIDIRLPGDVIGEIAVISERGRTATVTACGTVESMVVAREAFQRFLRYNPPAARALVSTVGERLRLTNEQRVEFTAYPVAVRPARLLAEIARTSGVATAEGKRIPARLRQQDLAVMIGATEVGVSEPCGSCGGATSFTPGTAR
jgi:CRP/FNR family cyclic AMP-dependent transcriptional regulator